MKGKQSSNIKEQRESQTVPLVRALAPIAPPGVDRISLSLLATEPTKKKTIKEQPKKQRELLN